MSPLVPTGRTLDRETALDVSVNVIPMGILLFFIVLTLLVDPFPPDLYITLVAHVLTIIPLVLLGLLTYVSAKVIARDERKLETSGEGVGVEETPAGADEAARGHR